MPNFKTIMENLTELTEVHLGNVQINSSSLQPLTSLSSLRALSLYHCGFSGPIPRWVWNISEEIVLFGNQFTGELPSSVNISRFSKFTVLFVSDNLLTGRVPSWLFSLPSLETLNLANNQFSGQLGEFVTSHLLSWIDLSGNKIQGSIPPSIFGLKNLMFLALSSNNLSGMVQLDMFCKLNDLVLLDLLHNSLSVTMSNSTTNFTPGCPKLRFLECSSCNITEFPDFLRAQDSLQLFDLSNNRIQVDVAWLSESDVNNVRRFHYSQTKSSSLVRTVKNNPVSEWGRRVNSGDHQNDDEQLGDIMRLTGLVAKAYEKPKNLHEEPLLKEFLRVPEMDACSGLCPLKPGPVCSNGPSPRGLSKATYDVGLNFDPSLGSIGDGEDMVGDKDCPPADYNYFLGPAHSSNENLPALQNPVCEQTILQSFRHPKKKNLASILNLNSRQSHRGFEKGVKGGTRG
ncbi:hypothetical protein Ancab_024984 [Ancistrocladus abbreviatus]